MATFLWSCEGKKENMKKVVWVDKNEESVWDHKSPKDSLHSNAYGNKEL